MRDVAEGNGHVDDAGRTAAWIVIVIIAVIGIVVLEEGPPSRTLVFGDLIVMPISFRFLSTMASHQ